MAVVEVERMVPVLTVYKKDVIVKNIFLVSSSSPTSIDDLESVIVIGRHPDCDIVLQHPCVSRFHLRLHLTSSLHQLFLFDLSSVHGTRISDRKIEPGIKSELREGESFRVGGSTRVYQLHWMSIDRAYDLENSIVPSKSGGKRARVRYPQIESEISDSSTKIESERSLEMNRTEELTSDSPNNIELETSIKIETEISNEQNRTISPSSSCEFTDAEINTCEEEEEDDDDDDDYDVEKIFNEIEQSSNSVEAESSRLPFPNTNFSKNEEHGLPSSPLPEEENKIESNIYNNGVAIDEETEFFIQPNILSQKTEEETQESCQTSVEDEKTELFVLPEDKVDSTRFENGVREDGGEEEEMFLKPLLQKPEEEEEEEEETLEMHHPGLELKEVTNIGEQNKRGRGEDKENTTRDGTAMCFSRIVDGSEVLNLVDSTCVPRTESNPIQQNPKSLQNGAQRPVWRLVVDTTTLSDESSRNSLRLLQGLRRTRLLIPSSVVRDLDRLSSTDPSYLSALRWIEGVAAEMPWWVYVEPLREDEEEVLEFALRSKGNGCDRPVLLSNDSLLKTKAALHSEVVIDTAERFQKSLVNPFSERFMWPGSTPRGRSWTYVDDVHLRSMYGEEGDPVGGMGRRAGLSQLIHSY